jgi:YbbR domain-containing protein
MDQKRYHIVIASIIFAVVMWLAVNMGYEYTVVKHIPVVIENMKEGKALKYPIPKKVTVRFKGYGWQLAALGLMPEVKYGIDVSMLNSAGFAITSSDLVEHVKLPVAIQPLDVKPETLFLALDDYKEKRVPIISHVVLTCREGFGQVGQIRLVPESVLVGGAQNIIGAISQWRTIHHKFDNQRTSIDEELPLEDPPSYDLDVFPSSVRLRVDVQPFAEKTFTGIALIAKATPLNREVIFIPPKMDVIVRGGIDQLAKLSPMDFQITVMYTQLLQDSSGLVTPKLASPEGITVIRRIPERFQFIIRKKL